MTSKSAIDCLFLDIGGVLLNDGWGHVVRLAASAHFDLEIDELELRHEINFSVYEEGQLSLSDYLDRVVFYKPRSFTQNEFREFLFAQSMPDAPMIDLIIRLKKKYELKVFVLSNEARELNAHRIKSFGLSDFVDGFISSCYVHLRKPDIRIFRLALDVAQVLPAEAIYIENTPLFVEIAEGLGIKSILHSSYESTRMKLAEWGLSTAESVSYETN